MNGGGGFEITKQPERRGQPAASINENNIRPRALDRFEYIAGLRHRARENQIAALAEHLLQPLNDDWLRLAHKY
jgi:hypothetical protein